MAATVTLSKSIGDVAGVRVIRHLYSTLLWDEPIARALRCGPYCRTIPVFTPQPQSHTALSLLLIVPTHRGMARLSWPGWLVVYWDRFSCTGSWTLDMVTHPITNRAQHRVTLFTETNMLPLHRTARSRFYAACHSLDLKTTVQQY